MYPLGHRAPVSEGLAETEALEEAELPHDIIHGTQPVSSVNTILTRSLPICTFVPLYYNDDLDLLTSSSPHPFSQVGELSLLLLPPLQVYHATVAKE